MSGEVNFYFLKLVSVCELRLMARALEEPYVRYALGLVEKS